MNKTTRIAKIHSIVERERDTNPSWRQQIMWRDRMQLMPVYEIPLEYLIYNVHNGRILSGVKSYDVQGKDVNPETEKGAENIENLLWQSQEDRNERTQKDIDKYGQKEVGIITNDGIIIDGNRRVMLLRRLGIRHFKTFVLPVTLEDDPIEIEKLETSYQMGEDEKLKYNPIEKYLKTDSLEKRGVPTKDIAAWMGEPEAKIKEYLRVKGTMDDYLDYLGYDGMYTQLYNREDQFIKLTTWLTTFYDKKSVKAFDGYRNSDVDDLKFIAFDYIRAKYEGKEFRLLAHGQKQGHFFGNKEIWESFRRAHRDRVGPILEEEGEIDWSSQDLTATLKARDSEYINSAKDDLEENLKEHEQKIYHRKHKNQPEKLLDKAIDEVRTARDNPSIRNLTVMEKVKELNSVTADILQDNAPKKLLEKVLDILTSFSIAAHADSKDAVIECLSQILKATYKLQKKIKQL